MNILFACGGTAGHINPALAIAGHLRQTMPDAKILFVGAGRELEKRLIKRAGFHIVNIRMSGLRRGFAPEDLMYNLRTAKNLVTAGIKAEKLIRRFKPDAVLGTGGYICYPILKKAAQLGIPTLAHEANAVPGLAIKLLSSTVDKVLTSFPGLEGRFRRPERVVFTGMPVRGGFSANPAAETPCRDKPLVVSFWGSLGSEKMNEIMLEFINLNTRTALFDHIHATGEKGSAHVMKARLKKPGAPDELPHGIEVREYIDDMQAVMAAADLIICRAGGSTIAELTALGKPAILIPSPYVTNGQQIENAEYVRNAGGAVMIHEKDCTGEVLYRNVCSLLGDKDKLSEMANHQRALGVPDAIERIVDIMVGLCGGVHVR